MRAAGGNVLTIGHSTHAVGQFIDLLARHGVTMLADVRAVPYSRFNPQFNRETLAGSLVARDLAYVFLGRELGGRSEDPALYDDGRIDYERVRGTRSFKRGLERVTQGPAGCRIALMCAEGEPLECHRCLLVAPALEARGVSVAHIRSDGELERHGDAMDRLMTRYGLDDSSESRRLFPRPLAERVTDALARQARRFAYRDQKRVNDCAPSDQGRGESHP